MSTIIRPWIPPTTGSTFVLRIVAFRARSSFLADCASSELLNGPPNFHSLDEEDLSSRGVDRLSSDSDADSSSDELDSAADSAPISTTSATALGFGDLCRFSSGS